MSQDPHQTINIEDVSEEGSSTHPSTAPFLLGHGIANLMYIYRWWLVTLSQLNFSSHWESSTSLIVQTHSFPCISEQHWTKTRRCPWVLRPGPFYLIFLILQTPSHTTHGEHHIVSGDSSTIQICDLVTAIVLVTHCSCDSLFSWLIVLVTHCSHDSLFLWLIVLMTHCSCDSLFLWLIVLVMTIVVVTAIVLVTLLFYSTISTVHLWPYSLRLDFLYPTVQNNRVFSSIPCLIHSKYSSRSWQTWGLLLLIRNCLSPHWT